MINKTSLELSIQVGLNGLSFSILDRKQTTIVKIEEVAFSKKQTPFYLLDKLQQLLETHNLLDTNFSKVQVIHQNELATLVPDDLFSEENLADYLKFNAKILQTDFITYDKIAVVNAANVYIPFVNINNYVFEQFGEFTYKHYSTVLIENILKDNATDEPKMFVNVNTTHFEIVVLNKKTLQLYNTFEYTTPEDFIYYILFTAEQLELDNESFQLELLGSISKNDDYYNIVYKYVRNVSFGNRLDNYIYETNQPENNYSNYTLLKSF